MSTQESLLKNRLVYFDCLSGIALALTLRNEKKITDEEYALLREAMQEISLLALHGTFLENQKGYTESVDAYLDKKLGPLGRRFNEIRDNEGRLKLDITLLLRERLLELINLFTKSAYALKGIITAPPLNSYDITLRQACIIEIKRLKDLYSLINCFPVDSALPPDMKRKANDLSKLLVLRHRPKKAHEDEYQIEKIQSFLLHKLVQVSSTLQCFLGDLKSLIPPPAKEMEEADKASEITTETLTDSLEKSLTAGNDRRPGNYIQTLPSLFKGLIAIHELLELFHTGVTAAPKDPANVPAQYAPTDLAIKADKSWLRYRQHQLESVAKNLIGLPLQENVSR